MRNRHYRIGKLRELLVQAMKGANYFKPFEEGAKDQSFVAEDLQVSLYLTKFSYMVGSGAGQVHGGQGGFGSYEPEGPSDFSYWAAALGFILAGGYLYTGDYGLTVAIIGGAVAAMMLGAVFNGAVKLIVFLFKISLFIGVLLGAVYLAVEYFAK